MDTFNKWESEIRGYCRLYPTVFKSASNARQVDENGKSYVDLFAGAGVLNFGHNNPRMKEKLIEFIQNDGIAHGLDMHTTAKREFIERFAATILEPRGWNYKMMFMGPTGTNAVESALKLARKVTGRQTVVAYTSGFHGMTLGSLAATANSYFRKAAGVPLNHIVRQPYGCEKTCVGCNFGCGLDSVERLRAEYENSSSGLEPPAAFLVEAIQAEGGVHVASAEWLRAVEKLARDLGALFIVDDIQAGCGRTGNYFSFDGMGLDPDIITLAKGIGGFGTPLAMNLAKPEHDRHWQPGEHTGTFRGQGLSFVAGVEALRYFEDDELMNEVARKGADMQAQLQAIVDSYPDRGFQVRGKGMMQAIDLVDGALAKAVASRCFEHGTLLGGSGTNGCTIKLIPPLTIPQADLQEGLTTLKEAIAAEVAEAQAA